MAADPKLHRKLRIAGLDADAAGLAAEVAGRHLREQRDAAIMSSLRAGLSLRAVAKAFGLAKSHVQRMWRDREDAARPLVDEKRDTPRNEAQGAAKSRGKLAEHPSRLVSLREAAVFVALSPRSFEQLVGAGNLPQPVQVTPRRIAWRLRDLLAWVEARPLSPRTGRKGTPEGETLKPAA